MGRYIVQRIVQTIIVLFVVCTVVFLLLRAVGDPARLLVNPEGSKEGIEIIRKSLGLDLPLWKQYVNYIKGIVTLDFGTSFTYKKPVVDLIKVHLPSTLQLTFFSLLIAVVSGVTLGCISAIKQYSIFDNIATFLAVFTRAVPGFWLGIMLILIFSVRLNWLPPSGYGSFKKLIMPSVSLGLSMAAVIARLTRSSMLEIIKSDYIRTARAKGQTERTIIMKHALRNTLIPVVTMVGLQMGHLLGGSIVIETVFAWPGIGRLLIESINVYDFPVIQTTVFMIAVFFVLINFFIDMLYLLIDPRIRLG